VSDESTAIVEVDREQAQAVLLIRSSSPGLVVAAVEEYYLARTKAPAPVTELTTLNPDDTVRLTSCFAAEQSFLHCARVDGRTSDGRGSGFGKTVSIEGHSSDTVSMRLWISWMDSYGRQETLYEELPVPWVGEARREFAGGYCEACIKLLENLPSSGFASNDVL
jgi:hypothetical protein